MDIFCRIPTEYDKRLAEKLGSPTIFVTSMVEAWKKDMGIKDPDRVPTEKEFEDYIKKTKKETKLLYDTTKKLDNEVSINIYAGTNESTDLSNFAERPFVFKLKDYQYLNELPQDTTFKTVEHAFQALKWDSQLALDNPNTGAILNRIEKILKAPTAAKARELGKMTDIPFDTKIWDEKSSYMMKDIIKASFEQNPQALQLLLSTGNATLTHSQDESTWKTEFPKLLMEVREELRGSSLGISPTKVGTLEPATSLNDEESSVIDRKTEEVIETHTTLEQDLGGGKEAKTEIKDAVMVAKKGMSFEEALAGQETFFTKEEQDQIKQGLNGKNLRVMSVSRLTDPAFFSKEIVTFLEQNAKKELSDPTRVTAIEIWSKHDGMPIKDILDACKKYRVAPMVSFSITGLGGTALEGGVMKYQDMLQKVGELIENGTLNATTTTVRIDPILPGVTNMDDIKKIVETAKSFGIKKFVTSLVQSYGYTEGTSWDRKVISGINNALATEGKTYDWNEYYGRAINGKINFKPKQKYIDEIGKVLLELDKDPEITIQTCAFGIKGLKVSACLDPMIIERITGVDVLRKDGTYDRDTSRPECMCYGCHGDFFKGKNKKCFSSCAYCYAAHSGDNKLNYYNEDGTLKDNIYTRTGKRPSYTLHSGGADGSDSYWGEVGKRYGVKQNHYYRGRKTPTGDTPQSDEDYKEGYEKAKKAAESMGRTWVEKYANLQARNWNQVKYADAIFAIGHLVKPGEKNKKGYEVTAVQVDGGTGYAVQMAMTENKPVYVFDQERNQWYKHIDGKWSSSETPVLTSNFAGIGTRELNDNGKIAIEEVYAKTFNASGQSVQTQQPALSRKQAIKEVVEKNMEKAKEMEGTSLTSTKYYDKDRIESPELKAVRDFTPAQRRNRVGNIVFFFNMHYGTFASMVENDIQEKLEQLNAADQEDPEVRAGISILKDQLAKIGDSVDSPDFDLHFVLSYIGVEKIKEVIRKEFEDSLNNGPSRLQKRMLQKQGISEDHFNDMMRKSVENFDILFTDALPAIEKMTGIRIVESMEANADGYSREENDEDNDSSLGDHEDQKVADMQLTYKIKKLNVHDTLSKKVRKLFGTLVKEKQVTDEETGDTKWEIDWDDIGMQQYIDPDLIHLTLLQEFNYMQSPDDFAEKVTENGKQHYKLKAFEKIRDKYPWVPAVLRRLITDVDSEDSMIPLLYSDLQKEYVKYSVIKGSQPLEINKPISEKFLLSQVRQNIEQGNILDGDSIYNSDGSLNAENVDKLKAQIGDDYTVDQMNAYLKEVAKRLRMIGFNINANDLTSLYPEDEAQRKRNKGYAGSDVKDEDVNARKPSYEATVLERELKNFYMYKDTILRAMTSQDRKPLYGASAASKIYENIAKVLGVITDAHASVQCVEKGITYQNYVAPCYINTKIEKILQDPTRTEAIDMEARQQFMDEEYKKYEWFYDHKNNRWRNPLFEMLYKESSNPNVRNLSIDTKDMVQINPADTDNNRNKKGNDYDNWTPENIYTASLVEFADNYFAPQQRGRYVWYSGPILSDSPVAKFYKLPYFNSEKSLNNREGNKKLLELYRALAKQEIWRINECLARQDNPHAQLIGSFDTKGRGTKFCFLECLNPYRNELLDMVNKGNMSEADALIDREVEKYINGEAEKLYGRIGNNGTVMSLLKEKYEKWAGQEVSPEDMEKAAKKMILDFAWNHNLAQANIYQLAITDIAYYKNDTDLQKRFKEIYAAGTKLFTSSKYGREFERTIYLRDIERPSRFLNGIRNVLNKAVESGRMTKGEAAAVIKKFHSMNLADAQAFRTLSSYRSVLDMAGLWDKRMQRTFERITAQKATMDDFMTIYQTIKPFMYTQVEKPTQTGDGCLFKVPHQNKNSEFLLMALYSATSAFSQSPMMRGLNDFMEANQIDVVQFESAVKSGAQGTVDIGVVPAKMANLIKKGLDEKNTAKAVFAMAFTKGAKWDNTMESRCNSDTFNKALDEVLKKMPNVNENAVNELCDTVAPNEEEVKEILERYCFKKNADGSLVMEGEGEDKKPVFDECVVHSLPYADYCIQQPTPEHLMDTKSILGSQFKNLIIANLPDGFTAKLHGKEYNKKDLVHLFQMLQTENLLEDFSKLRKEFGDIHKLRAFLLPMVQGSNKYGSDVEAALKIVKHGDKEVFNIPLDNPTTREKLEQLMLSCFKNRITKQYIKGGNAILVSSVGYTKELRIRYKADGSWEGVECYLPAYSRKFYAPLLKKVKQADGSTVEILDPSKLDDNLRKAIGYRIPTEEKYSMVPLIIKGFLPQQNGSAIMYPAEMMTLSGEDCDVDKKFLILPEFRMVKYKYAKAAKDFGGDIKAGDIEKMLHQGKTEEDIEKAYPEFYAFLKEHERDYEYRAAKAMKIKYDVTKDPKDNTREQRNNMIFDICYNILASQSSVADMHNPGNFDKLKRERNMAFVWDSEENIKNFCEYAEQEAGVNLGFRTEKQAKELAAFLEKADDKLLSNFYDKYRRSQDPLSLATFEYFHNQNTTGGKLIGVYAVNTVAHAKFQHLGVHLTDKYTFRVNGHLMEDLSRMANDYGETISFNCAQFSAASVDNVKDPVLADLMQNMDTAGIAGLMVRLGMSVHEVCALFTYPIIKDHIRSFGKLDPEDLLDKASGELPELDAIDLDINQIISDGIRISADSKVLDTDADVRKRMNKVLVVMANLSILAQSMRELVAATRADSPNGAAAISTAGAYIQVRRTKILDWKKSKPAYPFVGARDVIQSGLFTGEETADQLREMFENLPLPAMQAYYTLGVESTNRLLRGYFLTNNPVVESRLDTLGHSTKNCTLGESHVNAYIKDMMLFRLSMTKMFGNDPENHTTYDEKREFYTQIFPMEFIKFVQDKDNAEIINQVPSLRKIIYENGRLQMPDGAGLSRTYRDALKRDFDIFLGLAPDEAQKLFMYAYYAENLKFGPSCINPYFSSFFLASFPEYIDTLRGLEDELSTLPEWLERYDLQFAMNHKSAFAKIPSKFKFVKFDPNDRNKAIVSEDVGINIMGVPYKYVIIGKNLWEYVSYSFEQAEVIYSKITPFEGYNAYLTPEELAEQNKTDNTTRKVLSNIHTQDIFDYENVSNEYVDYIDYSKGKTKEKKKKDPYPAPEGKKNSNEEICTNKR